MPAVDCTEIRESICVYIYIERFRYMYIYIYRGSWHVDILQNIERERERERAVHRYIFFAIMFQLHQY